MTKSMGPEDTMADIPILQAAEELVARLGNEAKAEATARAAALAKAARWPEHDLALRVLTAVEHLLEAQL